MLSNISPTSRILLAASRAPRSSIPIIQPRCFTGAIHIFSHKEPLTTRESPFLNQVRHIYGPNSLGIYKLDAIKNSTAKILDSGKERYIQRIEDYINQGNTKALFKDDLVNLIGLAETIDHIDLIERLIKTSDEAKAGAFSGWGASVMRLYYKFRDVDRAHNNLKDESYGRFFDQRSSFQIVMTMLYDAGRHNEVIELYELSKTRLSIDAPDRGVNSQTSRSLSIIVYASLAKINTPEALEAAEKMYAEDSDNSQLLLRSSSFMAHLLTNSGRSAEALNIISDRKRNYVPLRELKTKCLLNLERYDDILIFMRLLMNESPPGSKVVVRETAKQLRAALGSIPNESTRSEMADLLDKIESAQLIEDGTVEDCVFRTIDRKPDDNRQKDYQSQRLNYNQQYDFKSDRNHQDRDNSRRRYRPRFGGDGYESKNFFREM